MARLMANGSFGPEEIGIMTAAYERAMVDLGITERDGLLTELIAKAIVNETATGERDPKVIAERALNALASVKAQHRRAWAPAGREAVLTNTLTPDHKRNRLLASLPAETLATMTGELNHISMVPGDSLYEPGALIDKIYFPQSGMISLLVVSKEGGVVETATVGREGAVGLHAALGKRYSFTRATTQVGGMFSTIGASAVAKIAQQSATLRDLITCYTELLWAEAQQLAACNAVHEAPARLCRWLLQCADRIDSNHLPLTQELMAQMLGVRRTTITLLAQSLQQRGVIKYTRGKITILDRKALEHCACECYGALQQEKLPLKIGVTLQ